ncbi:hypothetical protein AB0E08_07595 [Streptomyces sp. NPDC048281]|uniref:hypothetical protein n=1 Tax=Streptomyces sp. NPDC048281 TaxID=3154715 RepID=UPI00341C5476
MSGARYCGEDLGRERAPHTCRRAPGHSGLCSPARDRGSEAFDNAWAEYFDEHPEIQASFRQQNNTWPPGYVVQPDFDPYDEDEQEVRSA